jgi:hypothetical protein
MPSNKESRGYEVMISFLIAEKLKFVLCSVLFCSVRDNGYRYHEGVQYLLLNVRILSTKAVAAKAASVSNLSLRREVTIDVKMKT